MRDGWIISGLGHLGLIAGAVLGLPERVAESAAPRQEVSVETISLAAYEALRSDAPASPETELDLTVATPGEDDLTGLAPTPPQDTKPATPATPQQEAPAPESQPEAPKTPRAADIPAIESPEPAPPVPAEPAPASPEFQTATAMPPPAAELPVQPAPPQSPPQSPPAPAPPPPAPPEAEPVPEPEVSAAPTEARAPRARPAPPTAAELALAEEAARAAEDRLVKETITDEELAAAEDAARAAEARAFDEAVENAMLEPETALPRRVGIGELLTRDEAAAIGDAVADVWNVTAIAGRANFEDLVVTVRIQLTADGKKISNVIPVTPENPTGDYKVAFNTARRAVLMALSRGLPLPEDKFRDGDWLELKFDPGAAQISLN